MAQVRFYNIDWSLCNDISLLPKEITVDISEEFLDDEEIEYRLCDMLLEAHGREHNGFDYEII